MSKINEYATAINLAMGSGVTLQVISPSSSILASYLMFIMIIFYAQICGTDTHAILKKYNPCAYSGLSIRTVQNSAHYGINGTHEHGYHDPLSI